MGWHKEQAYRSEHTRAIVYFIAAANRAPGTKLPPIEKFWPLETDQAEPDKARIKRYKQLIKDALEKTKNRPLNG